MSAVAVTIGLCKCGCGQATTTYRYDDPKSGRKAGEHRDFAHGHWHNLKRKSDPNWGAQSRHNKETERIRRELALEACSIRKPKTLEEIRQKIAPGRTMWAVARMLGYSRENSGQYGLYPVAPELELRPKQQVRPPYERSDIANELETELPYLSRRRHYVSLDAPSEDSEEPMHSFVAGSYKTPLEILMDKEEGPEHLARQLEIERFERFKTKKTFGFYERDKIES